LYKASYLGDENIDIEKIDEGQLVYKANVYEGVSPIINLCTKEKFPSLAIRLYEDCKKLYSSYYAESSAERIIRDSCFRDIEVTEKENRLESQLHP
jgi:hypothetical protein